MGLWYGYDDFTMESIAQGYVSHNIPASAQKDRLFRALVFAGAVEADRSAFVQPASVVRVAVAAGSNPAKLAVPGGAAISEFFKKGTEPTEYDWSNYKLGAPANLTANAVGTDRITLSWSAVDPGAVGDNSHGKFGYNVYKDDVLITWTDNTSYSFKPDGGIYGVYKVIGTYRSYNDIQTDPATIEVKKQDPSPPSGGDEPGGGGGEEPGGGGGEDPSNPEEPTNP